MCRTTISVWRCAAIAAVAASTAGCAGGDVLHAERASADVTHRTTLVDDDGWPMPADPQPANMARPANAVRAATK
jgi:hypothetical protein